MSNTQQLREYSEMTKPIPRGLLYGLFALSGFAGLIYESIWSHYLKLMLGHAAYAQTLVLVIFMGGMAIGSWLAGRFSQRVARPLLWYAAIEAILGVAALLFDRLFRLMQVWLFDSVIVDLESEMTIDVVKWTAAAALTLPQAIMLGATFPLMSTGLMRMHPSSPGSTLSWLYFTNSLGASLGVLASGFYLIGKVGLPGTIMTAGLVNFLLALIVYLRERGSDPGPALVARSNSAALGERRLPVPAMLLTALLTGAASFMYEIGWIRMLSLVLGSATHSFELMLSAFILGLALGSFFIRKRIDASVDPLRLLGWIQVVMALLALLSLPLYMQTFDAMAVVFKALQRNEYGYFGFTLFSHLLCLFLMLPVTFCAGMTLPLVTAALLRAGHGESSIGRVYAANTVGAIAGVLLAVHVIMPLLGLRMVVVLGAIVDIGLGVWLLLYARAFQHRPARFVLAGALLIAAALSIFTNLDPQKTASGVFRHGESSARGENLFHRDGKTATVDVRKAAGGQVSIATNGKVDAGMSAEVSSSDDYTMVLLAAVPMSMLPEVKDVGVIGLGSGRSSHVFLSSDRVQRVDSVEIEPAMVEGARNFGDAVQLVFNDPRSHIVIEDAKTYFARSRRQYDIILSEPSNPWVSGVASLFSVEFYEKVKHYLRPDGLFVQWVHLYEIDTELVATIFKALGTQFLDYKVYFTNDGDMVIVASQDRQVPPPQSWVFADPGMIPLLEWVKVEGLSDIEQRYLGSKKTLAPFFASYSIPANSDYFPVLDQGAAERRFRGLMADDVGALYPYTLRLEGREPAKPGAVPEFSYNSILRQANLIEQYFAIESTRRRFSPDMGAGVVSMLDDLQTGTQKCEELSLKHNLLPALKAMSSAYGPYLSRATGEQLVAEMAAGKCSAQFDQGIQAWLDFLRAQTAKDWASMAALSEQLLKAEGAKSPAAKFLVAEGLLASYKLAGKEGAQRFLKEFENYPRATPAVRYLLSNAQQQ